jgi:hypothetical protein
MKGALATLLTAIATGNTVNVYGVAQCDSTFNVPAVDSFNITS